MSRTSYFFIAVYCLEPPFCLASASAVYEHSPCDDGRIPRRDIVTHFLLPVARLMSYGIVTCCPDCCNRYRAPRFLVSVTTRSREIRQRKRCTPYELSFRHSDRRERELQHGHECSYQPRQSLWSATCCYIGTRHLSDALWSAVTQRK